MNGTEFHPGDLVEYRPTGERWTVDQGAHPTGHGPRVLLGKSLLLGDGTIRTEGIGAVPEDVGLICRAQERSIAFTAHVGDETFAYAKDGEFITSWTLRCGCEVNR